MRYHIAATGISVVYEPEHGSPVADIVLVHGLHGHPYRSWTSAEPRVPDSESSSLLLPEASLDSNDRGREALQRMFSGLSRTYSKRSSSAPLRSGSHLSLDRALETIDSSPACVFWPADLLPRECRDSRVLMFGYDSEITKYTAGQSDRNSLVSHSRELLYSLCRERCVDRPLIFVAHSLGGIVVKEMLARSSESAEKDLNNVVESTASVIFLGTPHRGSPELASLGEFTLDALGLKTGYLERARETFSKLWYKHDFRVKTFQEGLDFAGIRIGTPGNKVVPDVSSQIGDPRERAETLQANHEEMCRFTGSNDPSYRKVVAEIRSIYASLKRLNTQNVHRRGCIQRNASRPPAYSTGSKFEPFRGDQADQNIGDDRLCLQSLWYPNMYMHRQNIEYPSEGSCSWLFRHKTYQDWFHNENRYAHEGLLWLKGNPGTGKSVLMKEAFRRSIVAQTHLNHSTAAFFFNAKGNGMEHSPQGLFRSLLHQLAQENRDLLLDFAKLWRQKLRHMEDTAVSTVRWTEHELRFFFQNNTARRRQSQRRIIIFIDALDECDQEKVRLQAYFWRQLTHSTPHLSVCFSSRHFPSIAVINCPEITVETHNALDISAYIERRFKLGGLARPKNRKLLRKAIMDKANGVFLWVTLVVDEVLASWDDGKNIHYLLEQVDAVPLSLQALYSRMLESLSPAEKQVTLRLFQWATLATKPLCLDEWRQILAITRTPSPQSLPEWRKSDYFMCDVEQLQSRIKSISKGLLEVTKAGSNAFDTVSIHARAGSLDLEQEENRTVHVIHESVRQFFLYGDGFMNLDPSVGPSSVGNGHLSIMSSCLDYIEMSELDALVDGHKFSDQIETRNREDMLLATYSDTGDSYSSWPSTQPDTPYSLLAIDMSQSLKLKSREHLPAQPEAHPIEDPLRGFRVEDAEHRPIYLSADERPVESFSISAKWIAITQCSSVDGSTELSYSQSSVPLTSGKVKGYPALLSYATQELFNHARLAESDLADPSALIKRLISDGAWSRWTALRDDIPIETSLSTFVREIRLHSWIQEARELESHELEKRLGRHRAAEPWQEAKAACLKVLRVVYDKQWFSLHSK